MARRPRLDMAGFHHIVNRGVERKNVFKCNDDKDKFLEILCKACKLHKVDIHTYCLMDNHYHLLIELSFENISQFMRQVNSNYAIYFNKKYKRVGHLWQGRYKSWYILNDDYLYSLFKYIEYNPVDAKITNNIGEYPFTLLGTILDTNLNIIPCAVNSKLKNELDDMEYVYKSANQVFDKTIKKIYLNKYLSSKFVLLEYINYANITQDNFKCSSKYVYEYIDYYKQLLKLLILKDTEVNSLIIQTKDDFLLQDNQTKMIFVFNKIDEYCPQHKEQIKEIKKIIQQEGVINVK